MRVKKKIKNILISSAILSCVAANIPAPVFSQIVPDGKTATTVSTIGNTSTITTNSKSGANAFNSFKTFNVNAGTTANLLLPTGTDRLFNIIKCGPSRIDGLVNAYKNGQIGGNVYFANPYGIIVGSQGSINTGSLTAITPTKQFVDNFFSGYGTPNPSSLNALINGTAPINPKGEIINKGSINLGNSLQPPSSFITGALFENKGSITGLNNIVNVSADVIKLAKGSTLDTFDDGILKLRADKITVEAPVIAGKTTVTRKTPGDITIISSKKTSSHELQLTPQELKNLYSEYELNIGTADTTRNINIKGDIISERSFMGINFEGSKDINFFNNVNTLTSVTANAGNKIFVSDNVLLRGVDGAVNLHAKESIALDKGANLRALGINLTSDNDLIRANTVKILGYDVNINAKKDINLTNSQITSNNATTIKSKTGNVNIKSTSIATNFGGGINIDAGRSVNIYCKSSLTTPLDIKLSGKNVNVSKDSTLNAGGQIIITKK